MEDAANNASNNNNNNLSTSPLPNDMVACENCGKPEHKTKLKKKRFCSPACARQAKGSGNEQLLHLQQQQQLLQQSQQQTQNETNANTATNNLNDSSNTGCHLNNNISTDMGNSLATSASIVPSVGIVDRMQTTTDNVIMQNLPIVTAAQQIQIQPAVPTSSSNMPAMVNDAPVSMVPVLATSASSALEQQPQMANWTVPEVCEFIKNLPGCSDYVDDFEQQEIDGQALLLLKENHLVNAMGMKLGPALKIVAKVESMKEISAAALNAANNAMETNSAHTQ